MNTKHNRLNVITLTLTSLLGFGAAMAAADADASTGRDVAVSYRDLDLSRPADVKTLYRRIEHAAASACLTAPPAADLSRHLAWERCYSAAIDSAVMQVRSPELLALYRSQPSRES
jgi:UrcA family protein